MLRPRGFSWLLLSHHSCGDRGLFGLVTGCKWSLRSVCFLLFLASFCTPFGGQAAAAVLVPDDVADDVELFLNGRTPLEVTEWTGPGSRRDVVEVVLTQQALHLGGWQESMDMVRAQSYDRILLELKSGRGLISATGMWEFDVSAAELRPVAPHLVPVGKFVVGVFTAQENTAAQQVKDLAALSQRSAVCNPSWRPDWEFWQTTGIKELQAESVWPAMVQLVGSQRVDYVLAPFPAGDDLHLQVNDVTLVPVPGMRIALLQPRCLAVSRTHPQGAQAHAALEKGLQQLFEAGVVEQAYRECGFYNESVADWPVVNLPPTPKGPDSEQ